MRKAVCRRHGDGSIHVRSALAGHRRRHRRAASGGLGRVGIRLHAATTETLRGHAATTLVVWATTVLVVRGVSHLTVELRVEATASSTLRGETTSVGTLTTMVAHITVLRDCGVSSRVVERHLHRVWAHATTL